MSCNLTPSVSNALNCRAPVGNSLTPIFTGGGGERSRVGHLPSGLRCHHILPGAPEVEGEKQSRDRTLSPARPDATWLKSNPMARLIGR